VVTELAQVEAEELAKTPPPRYLSVKVKISIIGDTHTERRWSAATRWVSGQAWKRRKTIALCSN
jgi:hypothetical protein